MKKIFNGFIGLLMVFSALVTGIHWILILIISSIIDDPSLKFDFGSAMLTLIIYLVFFFYYYFVNLNITKEKKYVDNKIENNLVYQPLPKLTETDKQINRNNDYLGKKGDRL